MHSTTPNLRDPPTSGERVADAGGPGRSTGQPLPASAGLLLVGHGTRDPQGQAEFLALAATLERALAPRPVVACFLELVQPAIADGVRMLLAAGATQIVVAPVLLFAAGHARRDIPAAVVAALRGVRGVTWHQTPAFGCHELLLALAARRASEALERHSQQDLTAGATEHRDDSAMLVLVGRGSLDRRATAEMIRFGELLSRHAHLASARVDQLRVAFVAMADPPLPAVLAAATTGPWRRVVVQPHLLFQGELLLAIGRAAQDAARAAPHQRWVVAQHLGPDPVVARLVAELAVATAQGASE